jgi:hypothetical protein
MNSIVLKVVQRSLLIAGLAALAFVGAVTGVALAAAPYTVKVSVVKPTVPVGSPFTVVAKGLSANTSQLVVYINISQPCRKTAAAESVVPSDQLAINTSVVGAYIRTKPEVGHVIGLHYACAYLRSVPPPTPVLLRARAVAAYHVVATVAG